MVPMGAIVAVVVIVDAVTVSVAPAFEEVLAAEIVAVVVVLAARLEQKLSFVFNTWCLRSNSWFRWMQFVG